MISRSLKRRLMSVFILLPVTLAAVYYGGWPFKIMVALAFGMAVREWLRMTKKTGRLWTHGIPGICYILIGFMAFIELRTGYDQGLFLTVVLMFGVWASDSFAYITGKLVGGPKLMPRVSPNKTWAGFIGGTLGSGLVLMLLNGGIPMFSQHAGLELLPFAPYKTAFIIGALFTVFGQIGDLGMSWYKRKANVKDTGTLIPGHGGLLDRIDSLLLVTPFFTLVLLWLGN